MGKKGGIDIGCVIVLAVLGVGGYVGWKFGLPYYYNSVFEEKMFQAAENLFHQDEGEIKKDLVTLAAENHITLTPEQISIRQTSREITMEARYEVLVSTPLLTRTLTFAPIATRSFSR